MLSMTIPPYFPVIATGTLILTAVTGGMAVITPEDADAYSFKAFLILCVIGLAGVILMGFKMWYRDMKENREEMVKALKGNTEALNRFIELFNEIGAEAMMKSLRPDGAHHSLTDFLQSHQTKPKGK